MAREHAQVRIDIWNDDDFRRLTRAAQLLYIQLLTSATLNYSGVADWRPKRLSPLSGDGSPAEVVAAAAELREGLFIVTDDDTEEVLIRSFLKHDGLLQKPNVTKAMVAAFGSVASGELRGVIVHELTKLAQRFPEWRAFGMQEVHDLLRRDSVDPSTLVENGDGKGLLKGSGKGSEIDASLLTPSPSTNSTLLTPSTSDAEASDSEEFDPEVHRLCDLLAELVRGNGHKVDTVGLSWWRACERLMRIDGRTPEQIEWIIRWATANEFWLANIRSMPKLREKFQTLVLQSQRKQAAPQQQSKSAAAHDFVSRLEAMDEAQGNRAASDDHRELRQ